MIDRKVLKPCRGCGKQKRIRRDREYCTAVCARRNRPTHDVTVVMGDAHEPHIDKWAFSVALQLTEAIKPSRVILNGDWTDCYQISKFAQPGSPGPGFPAEIEMSVASLGNVRKASGKATIDLIEGNHEFRLKAFLNHEGSNLKGLKGLTMKEQLALTSMDINYIECRGSKWFSTYVKAHDDLLVGHFDKTSCHSAYAGKGLIEIHGTNIITGHNHSAGVHHRTMEHGMVAAYEGGCLCTLDPPYMAPKNWAHAITVAIKDGVHPVYIRQIIINNGRAWYDGRLYKA